MNSHDLSPASDTAPMMPPAAGSHQLRGNLKIFLGMAAGVGKTTAMLEAAHRLEAEGGDVVVGWVETHQQPQVVALLDGLEIIAPRRLHVAGHWVNELDTDAVLARAPQYVLVDDLAHVNVPGGRHVRRWQDVLELLDHGIHVLTAVNVQHFESRADAVREITGVTVLHTVPDSLLDIADEVELVDLSPADVYKRLAEGLVYIPTDLGAARDDFFRLGNLTALREMALRLTAEHVDHKLQDYMQVKQIAGPWKSGERLMVAVGPSPFSERLIRWTRRMAYNMEAPWLAVYIETSQGLAPGDRERLARNIALARSLGGEIVTIGGKDIAATLLRVARQRNVTQIVVGKPQHSRLQTLLRGGSLVDEMIRKSGDIDIYVVTGDPGLAEHRPPQMPHLQMHSQRWQYILALLVMTSVTGVDLLLFKALPGLGSQAVGLTALFAVLVIAAYLGRGPALLAAAISAVAWNFLFINPRLTLTIEQLEDIILFLFYFAIAIFTGNLTARIRGQERHARYITERTAALYTFARETATALNMDDILKTAVMQLGQVFQAQVAILLSQQTVLERQPHPASSLPVDDADFNVAAWVYSHNKAAGRFTDTFPQATIQFHPLHTSTRTVGVIGLRTVSGERLLPDQEVLLETFMSQVALVIEREQLDEAAEQSAMLQESERLHTTLLNSISHELRTPIATIKGAASSLLNPSAQITAPARAELTRDIQSAADRLNRLVENLLDMSRLESGRLQLKLEWCDVSDLIAVAVQRVNYCAGSHPMHIDVAPGLPLIEVDFVLVEQVIVNLLDNACNYTPIGTPVSIEAQMQESALQIIVSDSGPGIPPELLDRVFDKFYRLPGTVTGGTGLGLSICRGLIEAHGGSLKVGNRAQGGAEFRIRLPLKGVPPPVQEAIYD